MATQQPPADVEARREQVKRDLEAAIAQVQEEIRALEAELVVKRKVEQLRAEWARTAAAESEAGK